ncbi:hypothetical protein MVEG_12350 [Podila verticillata NRRL 6337]|uniref:DUF726-domain-containing protein n=1 Tax=Podila verticillata NRRL 6337 TaxID=1069443 RepID=A0A086TIR5_9FUNG|nr:hypothetical protein MVEG_12350 [Podila verticillata NRRL 6337]
MHSIAPAVDPVQTEVEMDAEVAQLSSPTIATSTPKMSTASSTTANIGTSITIQSEDTLTTAPPTLPQQQQPQANTTDILDVTNEDDFLFYMNDTPQQDSGLPSKKNNSELASDDSEDDLDHEDRKMKPLSGQHHSNSSLATVAESAIEKPVRLAMILPGAVISDGRQGVNDESQGDVKTEVFMDRDGHGDNNANCSSSPLGPEPCLVLEYSSTLSASRSVSPNNTEALDKTANINNESIHPVPTTPSSPSSPTRPTLSTSEVISASSATDASASKPCDIDASKDMLTEGQAFAYVGLCLVTANTLFQALEGKETAHAKESLESFVSKLINRLYKHLEIDANTQRTIAQLPQMMIQPEDLLETFVADGTQRVVSAQQVDQAGLSSTSSSSAPNSPTITGHRRHLSNASQSSLSQVYLPPQPESNLASGNESGTGDSSPISRSSASSSSSVSVASLPRESTSKMNEEPLATVSVDAASTQAPANASTTTLADSGDNIASIITEQTLTSEPSSLGPSSSPSSSPSSLPSSSPSPSPSPPPPRPISTTPYRTPSPLHSRMSTSSQRTISSLSNKAITVDLRWTLIADLFLISISDSVYDARARVLLKTVGRHLGLEWQEIVLFEKSIMKQLQQQAAVTSDGLLKPDTKSRNDESRKRRMIMMGLATVGGGLVLGLSAGLFAPVIGAGIGAALAGAHITGATATAASAFLAGSGGIAVITSGAAVTGSGLAMKKMARRTAGIDTFEFLSIHDHKRANVILTISGWLDIGDEDASLPFSTLDPINGDQFALFWEPEMLMALGNALGLLATEVITLTAQEILKHTLLSALLSALAWPMALTRLGYLIDNPWSIALDRAKLAGLVLADSLLMRSYLGFRPVTLVGYSLGARVIFYCLMELGRLDAFGIVENAYLFGAPITASEIQWRQARSAVAGEFVNGYLRNDWVLGFLFRATTGGLGTVAGLRPIKNVPGLTNMDLTSHVEGHLDYRLKIPLLMKLMGLKITSESFLEKEEAILHQRSLKINPNEQLKAPKPMMPSKLELAKSESLTESEKQQLEVAFRRPAPKAKIPDLDTIKGLTDAEKEALREALTAAAAANSGTHSPAESYSRRR